MELSLIGLQNAGKSSLVNVLTTGSFHEDMIPTVRPTAAFETSLPHVLKQQQHGHLPAHVQLITTGQQRLEQNSTLGAGLQHVCPLYANIMLFPTGRWPRLYTTTTSHLVAGTAAPLLAPRWTVKHPGACDNTVDSRLELQVGFNMRKVTKGGVTIKMWDLGGQVRCDEAMPAPQLPSTNQLLFQSTRCAVEH